MRQEHFSFLLMVSFSFSRFSVCCVQAIYVVRIKWLDKQPSFFSHCFIFECV